MLNKIVLPRFSFLNYPIYFTVSDHISLCRNVQSSCIITQISVAYIKEQTRLELLMRHDFDCVHEDTRPGSIIADTADRSRPLRRLRCRNFQRADDATRAWKYGRAIIGPLTQLVDVRLRRSSHRLIDPRRGKA